VQTYIFVHFASSFDCALLGNCAPSRQGASESSEAQMITHCVVSLLVLFERVEVLSSAIKDV
jgi:hypothetical protein